LFHDLTIRNPLTNVNQQNVLAVPNRVTYNVVMPKKKIPDEVMEYFVKMGRKGGKIGGRVRAERMTAEQRQESARKAVIARWDKQRDAKP